MVRISPQYIAEATRLVEARIAKLEAMSYAEAKSLPDVEGADAVIAGRSASVTVFRHDDAYELQDKTLVVVLAATSTMLGMGSFHVERGLVFSPCEPLRRASERELQNSGC